MHALVRAGFSLVAAVVAIPACGGGGDDLDPGVVTSLPPGDGTGTAVTGSYSLGSVTTACDGGCSIEVDGFQYSACDIGTRLDSHADVTQTDGALDIDVTDSDYVSQLSGGINADGSFDVGGLRTQNGGGVTITARSIGAISGAGAITGTGRLHVNGMGLDCHIGVDLDGTRE